MKTDKGPELLSICCSFRRPEMLKDMLDTWQATKSPDTDIFIYLHIDDPYLADYKKFVDLFPYTIGPHRTLTEVANYVFLECYKNIPYGQLVNDDHRYKTYNWDKALIHALETKGNGWGFACGRDLIHNDNWMLHQHPSAEVFSRKQAEFLGYVYPPEFKHQWLDVWAKDLGIAIGGLIHVPSVVIEHLWAGGQGKDMPDDNIREKYDKDSMEQAKQAFEYWKKNRKAAAVKRIMEEKKNGR